MKEGRKAIKEEKEGRKAGRKRRKEGKVMKE